MSEFEKIADVIQKNIKERNIRYIVDAKHYLREYSTESLALARSRLVAQIGIAFSRDLLIFLSDIDSELSFRHIVTDDKALLVLQEIGQLLKPAHTDSA